MEKNVLHDIRLKMEFLLLCAMLVLSVRLSIVTTVQALF